MLRVNGALNARTMSAKYSRIWYINHLLATLSVLLMIVMLAIILVLVEREPHEAVQELFSSPRTGNVFPVIAPFFGMCLIASLWLWVAMLRDYLRNRDAVSRAWMFWLIASSWGAAIVYFFVVWRPRVRELAGPSLYA